MKKFLFLLIAISSLCACTTPEEDAQIRLFWLEQIMQLMPKQERPALPPQPLPVIPDEETLPVQEEPSIPEEIAVEPQAPVAQPNADLASKKPTTARHSQTQFIEITLEDSRVNKLKSNASLKDRQAMQRAIERVKQANQQALQDIGIMFDGDTQAQAFVSVSKTKKILTRTANTSNNYQNYLNAQRKILQEQDQQLNQLMRQNAYKLRHIRG